MKFLHAAGINLLNRPPLQHRLLLCPEIKRKGASSLGTPGDRVEVPPPGAGALSTQTDGNGPDLICRRRDGGIEDEALLAHGLLEPIQEHRLTLKDLRPRVIQCEPCRAVEFRKLLPPS